MDEDIERFDLKVEKGSNTYNILKKNYKNLLLESIKYRRDVRKGKEKDEYDFVSGGFRSKKEDEVKQTVRSVPVETVDDGPKINDVIQSYVDEVGFQGNMSEKSRLSMISSLELSPPRKVIFGEDSKFVNEIRFV